MVGDYEVWREYRQEGRVAGAGGGRGGEWMSQELTDNEEQMYLIMIKYTLSCLAGVS